MKSLRKLFRRWAFARGRRFTNEAIEYFVRKYVRKYVRKLKKTGEIDLGDDDLGDVIDRLIAGESVRAAHPRVGAAADAMVAFTAELRVRVDGNLGLSHSKVREYWLYRGPRQLVLALVFVAGTLGIQEVTHPHPSTRTRGAHLATGLLALATALFALYYRLPDSIRASVSRSAHDHYVSSKRTLR